MAPCANLFRQKAEEGRALDALPLLRSEALKKARALWSLVWRVLVRCALEGCPNDTCPRGCPKGLLICIPSKSNGMIWNRNTQTKKRRQIYIYTIVGPVHIYAQSRDNLMLQWML